MTIRRMAAAGIALMIVSHAPAGHAEQRSAAPAFVGCPSDGQQGPQPPPSKPASLPHIAVGMAQRLAYYRGQEIGVMAPSGWHCLELAGSAGTTLVVAPTKLSPDIIQTKAGLTTDVVVLKLEYGGTSGRWGVARVAGGLFPVARKFVTQVNTMFPATPVKPMPVVPSDRLQRRSSTRIDYLTPPTKLGLGTDWPLAPSFRAVSGFVQIFPSKDMDMAVLQIRLSKSMSDMSPIIIDEADQNLISKF